ncbi:MAG TPA: hypothetical protein VFE88_03080 [Candidatus Nanoarchaeia archaeon]|nr:hypothetical protein [Candidatus Nanoarchaeia archaeon]
MAKEMNEGIYCAKCNVQMKQGVLPKHEYEEGYLLHNVRAYQCSECNKTFFTEEQAHEREARTAEVKEYTFGFEQKVTISGKSLVVGILQNSQTVLTSNKEQKSGSSLLQKKDS